MQAGAAAAVPWLDPPGKTGAGPARAYREKRHGAARGRAKPPDRAVDKAEAIILGLK